MEVWGELFTLHGGRDTKEESNGGGEGRADPVMV